MPIPFVVVDQNQMRCADVIVAAIEQCRREHLQILMPDVAGFEFSKVISRGGDPFQTWQASLQVIAPFSEYVVLGRKLTDVWKEEISEGAPCARIVDDGATELFRNLLRQINSGNESGLRDLIHGSVMQLMPTSLDHWSNHEEHRVMLCTVRDWLRSQLAEATIKDLRTRKADGMLAWLSSADGVRFVFQRIQARVASPAAALRLAIEPSAYGGFLSGMAAIGLYWLAFGGLDQAKPEAVTNDLHDLDYGVLGALSHSLLTVDKRLRVIHQAIRDGYVGRGQWLTRACSVGPEKA
jgi:hypothetical protein